MTAGRSLRTIDFHGKSISFIASNNRLTERVDNLSNEREVLDYLYDRIEDGDHYWDIGACLGIHTLTIAKHNPHGEVVSFEPMHVNRGVLTDNVYTNNFENVFIERRALANEVGETEFAIRQSFEAGWGRHSIATGNYDKLAEVTVPVTKGDTLARGYHDIPQVVKIDVEGAGPLVLQGMEQTLRSPSCHTVIFETHEPNPVQPSHEDFGFTRNDIIEFLEHCGFTVSTPHEEWLLIGEKHKNDTNESTNITINVTQGDIANQSADALINAAGTSLRMGTGVAGALKKAAGPELNNEAIRKGPTPLGSAVKTDAYDLDADYVIHAAAMPHYGDQKATTETIKLSLKQSLQIADKHKCSHVVTPAIGCGLAGVDITNGAKAIVETIRNYDSTHIQNVTLIGYTEREADIFKMTLKHNTTS